MSEADLEDIPFEILCPGALYAAQPEETDLCTVYVDINVQGLSNVILLFANENQLSRRSSNAANKIDNKVIYSYAPYDYHW